MKKKILIITYAFAPALTGGMWRSFKFAKYLPEFGIDIDVLTTTLKNYDKEDYNLLDELPDSVKIYRIKPIIARKRSYEIRANFEQKIGEDFSQNKKLSTIQRILLFIRNNILIPDVDILWGIKSIPKILNLYKHNEYDAIYASGPPFSVIFIAYIIKLVTKTRLIVDFRDPWTQWFTTVAKNESKMRKNLSYILEKKIISSADKIIATTVIIKNYLFERLGEKEDKFHVIYNGVDLSDFQNVESKVFNKYTMLYTGLLNDAFYSPEILFKAIDILNNDEPNLSSNFEFIILGKISNTIFNLLNFYKISDIVNYKGYLSHNETIAHIKGADLLILLLNPGVTDYITISGKIFEYLTSQNPILALIPFKSAAGDILNNYSRAKIISSQDPKIIAQNLYNYIFNNEIPSFLNQNDKNIIYKFNRRNQAKELSQVIKKL